MDYDMYQRNWYEGDFLPHLRPLMLTASFTACVFGAAIICIDVLVRQFPRWRNFSIAESDAFLSGSLSLSFGVMVSLTRPWSDPRG